MDRRPALGLDVYLALAAVGWADGNLDQEEADAIVKTAVEEGLSLEEIERIEHATQYPVPVGSIDQSRMSEEDRLFVYAVAVWVTRLDGAVSQREQRVLALLGDALKLPERARAHAQQVVYDVAGLSDDMRPLRYDLVALRRVIGERLRSHDSMRPSRV